MFGFNSRESHQGAQYDIQTQEVPQQNFVETRVYRNGRVLGFMRFAYKDEVAGSLLKERMARQHEEVCGRVRDGNYALIFVWLTRGAEAFESGEFLQALVHFESVLGMDGTHQEANGYLDRIKAQLDTDEALAGEVHACYEREIGVLLQEGRTLEAGQKQAVLARLGLRTKARRRATSLIAAAGDFLRPLSSRLRTGLKAFDRAHCRRIGVSAATMVLILCAGFIFTDAQFGLDPVVHTQLAEEYLAQGQVYPARNLFHRLLLQDPESGEHFCGFWRTFEQDGDYVTAVGELEKLLRTDVPRARLQLYLAEALRRASRHQEALVAYEAALRGGAPSLPCQTGRGLCLLGMKKPEEAISLWLDLRETEGQGARIDTYIGLAYRQAGRMGRASFFLSQALKKDPTSRSVTCLLADCLERLHQGEQAQRLRERAGGLAGTDRQGQVCQDPLPQHLSAV